VGDEEGLLGCEPPPEVVPDPDPLPPDPLPPEPLPEPPSGLGEEVGLDVCDGEDVGVGEGVDVVVAVLVTGGAVPGGTLAPAARSCCQDHPTEPPAGTVSDPTP
jgi:hypothetical protein